MKARSAGEIEPGQTIERVVPPRAVVDATAHGFAELAVAWNVDADFFLSADHIDDGGAEMLLEALLVSRFARFACAIGFDQVIRTRQAAGLACQNMVATRSHDAMHSICCDSFAVIEFNCKRR